MKINAILVDTGWSSLDSQEQTAVFQEFAAKCNFSLKNDRLIDPKCESIGVDFTEASRGAETALRRFVFGVFKDKLPNTKCVAMDINHGMWFFVPVALRLSDRCEPCPIDVLPWAEYIVLSDCGFENGLICNPNSLQIVAFGNVFSEEFRSRYSERVVPQ